MPESNGGSRAQGEGSVKNETKIGYIDDIDFEYHLGGDDWSGVKVYPTMEAVQADKPCCANPKRQPEHCGILKVRVEVLAVVQPVRRRRARESKVRPLTRDES